MVRDFRATGTTFLLLFFIFLLTKAKVCAPSALFIVLYIVHIFVRSLPRHRRLSVCSSDTVGGCSAAPPCLPSTHDTDYGTMPPRRATAWVSHGTLLSDRIRPSPGSPQPTKSDKGKGKGKAKAATPEPPPRSAAVRRLDDIVDGFHSSSTSNQSRNETKRETTAPGAASADRDGCFCQGTSPVCSSPALFFSSFPNSHHSFLYWHLNYCRTSPSARSVRIHAPLPVVRSRPLRLATAAPPLPTLRRAAPRAACAGGARHAAGGAAGEYAQGGGGGAREGCGGAALG